MDIQGKPVNTLLWQRLRDMYPNISHNSLPARLLGDYGLKWSMPNKGSYKIETDQTKCRALMFYPKSGRLVIQLNGKNRAHSFASDDPKVLMIKAQSFCSAQRGDV